MNNYLNRKRPGRIFFIIGLLFAMSVNGGYYTHFLRCKSFGSAGKIESADNCCIKSQCCDTSSNSSVCVECAKETTPFSVSNIQLDPVSPALNTPVAHTFAFPQSSKQITVFPLSNNTVATHISSTILRN
ncbi:hypothetical protein CHISP_3685 [Chitinispirillum alkaliphilum]|nr:hypothetical protein CHISP_3685 [Chitinispirillum alkaliphilum]